MATQTTNYGLTLPANNDNYDVGDFNGNFSKIDAQMKANADAAKMLETRRVITPTAQLPTMAR